jgi:hypothetical protein
LNTMLEPRADSFPIIDKANIFLAVCPKII